MFTRSQVDGIRNGSHAVHSMVLNQTIVVDPKFGSIVAFKVEGPIPSFWYVDNTSKPSTPMGIESGI